MKNTIKTVLHYYSFNLAIEGEKESYLNLCNTLKSNDLKVFDSISMDHSSFYSKQIAPLNGQTIDLETEHLFKNQWNTAPTATSEKGLRVFDWAEPIYPNRAIKEGMYLEQTKEMVEIRQNTYKCNYCGKNHYKPVISFCESCIGSEYLTEKDLPLLFLTLIAVDKTNFSGVNLPDDMLANWREAHKKTMLIKLEKMQAQKKDSIKKDISQSKLELKAFTWLINKGIDFNNVIYYKHTDTFCFGWRNSLNDDQKSVLTKSLAKFPYKYSFK